MSNIQSTLDQNSDFSHPFFDFFNSDDSETDRAKKLNKLLLDISREPSMKSFSPSLRAAVDTIRSKFIGYNRNVTKNKILKLIKEFQICEMADFLDEYDIDKKEIRAALDDLIREGKVYADPKGRRRWQEPGEHYNETFRLV